MADAERNDHLSAFERRSVDQQRAKLSIAQWPLQQRLQFLFAGFDEVLADG
jgi:hypothetical protein